jgi:hypothetical protein
MLGIRLTSHTNSRPILSRVETQMYYMAAHLRLHPGAAAACAPQEVGARGLFRAPVRSSTPEQPVGVATSGDRALAPAIWRSPQTGRSQLAFARMVRDTHILGMEIGGRGPAASAPVRVAASPLADRRVLIGPNRHHGGGPEVPVLEVAGARRHRRAGAHGAAKWPMARMGRPAPTPRPGRGEACLAPTALL